MFIKFIYISLMSVYEALRDTFYDVTKSIAIVRFFRPLYLASAYIITNEAAHKLLKINTPIFLTADRLPNFARVKNNRIHNKQNETETFIMKAISPLITEQQREVFVSGIANQI